jgi:hypothetical protein
VCHRAVEAARESDPRPVAREVSTTAPLAAAVAASSVLAATEDGPSGPVHLAPAYKIAARSLLAIGVLVLFYGFALAMAAGLAIGAFLLVAGGFLYGIIVVLFDGLVLLLGVDFVQKVTIGELHAIPEGLNMGHRRYDSQKIEPLFPFGFGLSYTDFRISSLEVTPRTTDGSEPIRVQFWVENTG